jgi:hypothetical protein
MFSKQYSTEFEKNRKKAMQSRKTKLEENGNIKTVKQMLC